MIQNNYITVLLLFLLPIVVFPFLYGYFFKRKTSYKKLRDLLSPFSFVFGIFFFWYLLSALGTNDLTGSPAYYFVLLGFCSFIGLVMASVVTGSFYLGHKLGKRKR